MTQFHCTVARTPGEIADAQRVRWIVYGEEERLLPPSAGRDGREVDARDQDDNVVHLLVYASDEPVGTIRLMPARAAGSAASAGSAGALGLDLESRFDLRTPPAPGVVAGEVTRYCVVRRYRCTPVAGMLHLALVAESQRRGITHWFAAANMETNCADDAALIYDLVRARHLVDLLFQAEPRPTPPNRQPRPHADRRVYTDDERQQARDGDGGVAGLRLPRTIALFTRKMGARCIGAPAYDPTFNVFALPIVANAQLIPTAGAAATPGHSSASNSARISSSIASGQATVRAISSRR